jgi:beta-ribofuranosylaminobenzene 5'-phosphate synthase
MSDSIVISTGARLHFGFFAHAGAAGPSAGTTNYGGIGLMIDSPGFVLAAKAHERQPTGTASSTGVGGSSSTRATDLSNLQSITKRALSFISLYDERSPNPLRFAHRSLEVRAAIPQHQGLGAGSQLGMAVAKALSLVDGEPNVDAVTLARRVGRGARSAIGIHGFERGGFLVDAGKQQADEIGTLEARVDVPAGWRFLLVSPPGEAAGLSGSAESDALSKLPATPAAVTERLRRLVATEILPALQTAECARFGEAIFEFGQAVGEYFRPIQGGTYATPLSSELVDWIRALDVPGVAQSSWGPTLAVCCPDQESAKLLARRIEAEPRWRGCRAHFAAPLNTGAKVELLSGS